MPSLGADIETGTLVQWLVKPGDRIKRGDVIAVVETEKGAIEIEVFVNGIVHSFTVQEGEKVPVGTVLALIAADGEAPAVPTPPAIKPVPPIAPPPVRPVTPAAAAAMARSKREIPHYYLGTRIDMSRAMAWLREENLKRSVNDRLLYSVMLLKAVALALRDFPELNGFWVDGAFKPGEGIHVGVAISLRLGGLVAPAIHDVDKKNLSEIMTGLHDLVKRVRAGVLRSSEIADATITVTSLGEQGVEHVFGVIYPPQVALVGFGKIVEQPWAQAGMVGVRLVIMASLSGDHRASDGHRGGLFLAALDRLLQEPERL